MSNEPFARGMEGIPLVGIVEPRDEDVLCGRGGAANQHPGNITYRNLVNSNKDFYIACLKQEKLKISKSIVATIREQRGRFLDRDANDQTWHDIGDKKAVEKTSQALREGQPQRRQKLAERGVTGMFEASFPVVGFGAPMAFNVQRQMLMAQQQHMAQQMLQQQLIQQQQQLQQQQILEQRRQLALQQQQLLEQQQQVQLAQQRNQQQQQAPVAVPPVKQEMDTSTSAPMDTSASMPPAALSAPVGAAAHPPVVVSKPVAASALPAADNNNNNNSLMPQAISQMHVVTTPIDQVIPDSKPSARPHPPHSNSFSCSRETAKLQSHTFERQTLRKSNSDSKRSPAPMHAPNRQSPSSHDSRPPLSHMPLHHEHRQQQDDSQKMQRRPSGVADSLQSVEEEPLRGTAAQYRNQPASPSPTSSESHTPPAQVVDRRRMFARMKYSRPPSGRFNRSQRSLGDDDMLMVGSLLSLMSNLSNQEGRSNDSGSVSKSERYLGSRRSVMSGLSKISDASAGDSIFSDLSRKIGNVSTRSIAMSEISVLEEEGHHDLEESFHFDPTAAMSTPMQLDT
eukprot:Nitzschia sp. Nitz4//scaffold169_size48518//19103//20803//NITZ4_007070-RA/size48518-processed-gene-0.92-mRNA-1//-1//CDS//3329538382//5274//frame0